VALGTVVEFIQNSIVLGDDPDGSELSLACIAAGLAVEVIAVAES
jgi:hypothetical protein